AKILRYAGRFQSVRHRMSPNCACHYASSLADAEKNQWFSPETRTRIAKFGLAKDRQPEAGLI
ncbi:MAG: hypothetical protein KBG72_08650, partial [Agrobacterium sp.]|nr:hypothetical protein [Agrobacterium sp.]